MILRVEELVEMLQDRRRRADQAAMLLIQQQQESKGTESQVRSTVFICQTTLLELILLLGHWSCTRGFGTEVFTVIVAEQRRQAV